MSSISCHHGLNAVQKSIDKGIQDTREKKSGEIQIIEEAHESLSVIPAGGEDRASQGFVLQRTRTYNDGEQGLGITSNTWKSRYSMRAASRIHSKNSLEHFSDKGLSGLQLPSFVSLGISSRTRVVPRSIAAGTNVSRFREHNTTSELGSTSPTRSSTAITFCSGIPPLTPPAEDSSSPEFHLSSRIPKLGSIDCSIAPSESLPPPQSNETPIPLNQRIQNIIMPESSGVIASSQLQNSPWVARASRKILNALNSAPLREGTSVISQTLPSQGKDTRTHPTFEEILETLQADPQTPPYITITHAVPQVRVMDELPKTPPGTPGPRHESSDYFGNDQTIFTHAAVVPIYHSYEKVNVDPTTRITHRIAAPSSVQVSILERYIPPSMPEEINDFFDTSARSYLSDRLSELSANNGSLLLIYPTREGGSTFAQKYVGPVIDPCLRQFIMLKGVTSDAASRMGKMTAVDHMIAFEEMETKITSLCQKLTARPAVRGTRSTFNITHSESVKIVLERATWMDWFIEQEQARFRQNLVEYHQAGGRMPEPEGIREVTVGMLTRDLIESIQKSTDPAGDAEIELGVFLITRSVLQ